jgi:hypothetical protein
MRQPARPDLWEARVRQSPGPTRQRVDSTVRAHRLSPVFDVLWGERAG